MSNNTEPYVVIVGGLNMDIAGISGPIYMEKDSNVGKIHLSPGGVGRNIAHNLVQYDVTTYLMTLYGDDDFGDIVEKSCQSLNIRLDYAEKLANQATSTYMYFTDNKGDMVGGVNDMAIVDKITPEFLEKRLTVLNEAAIVVVDANIPQRSIEWIAENVTAPIFADPVSTIKASRFESVLDKIDTMKPNEFEAELFTGIKIIDDHSAYAAARKMIDLGVKNVYISIGAKGMVCANRLSTVFVPVNRSNVISVNGAGDTTMATIVWARLQFGETLAIEEVSQLAQAAAGMTVESKDAVSSLLSVKNVIRRAEDRYQFNLNNRGASLTQINLEDI